MTKPTDLTILKRDAKEMVDYLKLLANPERLLMLCQMDEREVSVGELTELSGLSQSAVSQHLARFRRMGIVSQRGAAQTRYYSLSDPKMQRIIAALCEACHPD
ncbi:ArsR/SmtB family transcription factor [Sphingopyxis fribergensis]